MGAAGVRYRSELLVILDEGLHEVFEILVVAIVVLGAMINQ